MSVYTICLLFSAHVVTILLLLSKFLMKKNDKNQDNRYTQTITVTNSIMEKSRSVNQISPNQITEDKAYPIILFT